MLLNPQPSDEVLSNIYGNNYFIFSDSEEGQNHTNELKLATAKRYLNLLVRDEENFIGKKLLEIGSGSGDFLLAAASLGIEVVGVEYSKHACKTASNKLSKLDGKYEIIQGDISLLDNNIHYANYDFVVFCDVLEHVRDPRNFIKIVYKLLKPHGRIFCAVPSLDSWSAKLLKTDWMEFKLEHLFYFNTKNLRSLFFQEGFSNFEIMPSKKTLSIDYIAGHFHKHPVPLWSSILNLTRRIFPKNLLRTPFDITASGIVLICTKKEALDRMTLSVVMPAFNEEKTVRLAIERVLNKTIEGLNFELIIIESNSNDNTRNIVLEYRNNSRVKIMLEDSAQGKGHAVRAGLAAASGDFILIQDADDEYDIDDYDLLIEPLIDGQESFVLGARHGGSLKMRKFSNEPIKALILNCGHWFFTFLVNLMYRVKLKDPFTMYKVFRKDAIKNLAFTSNRFDFDFELLIKLIKKGFIPIEIPVNYRSRSFAEGKKVRMIADPITWLWALIKFRLTKN